VKLTKVDSLPALLSYYSDIWKKNWHDSIVITKKDLAPEHYQALGKKMIETYYQRYAPFDSDITIHTEMRLDFVLDDENKHKMIGYIDRLSRTRDGVYWIHDYKTSAHLPGQEDADNDRQLGLYHTGIQKRWPDIKEIKLVWHYLAFDRELVSSRSEETIARLIAETANLINNIESDEEFPSRESNLCEWCEYPDLCSMRKHFYTVEALPVNEYLSEPGVVLVNKYAELRQKAKEVDDEIEKVREAIIDYAQKEEMTQIKGSGHKVRVKFDKKLKFPGKSETERKELDDAIIEAGRWMEVSQLDTTALIGVIEGGLWDKELIDEVLKFGRIEESSSVYLSKLKDEEI